jgi:hypothetical protein
MAVRRSATFPTAKLMALARWGKQPKLNQVAALGVHLHVRAARKDNDK